MKIKYWIIRGLIFLVILLVLWFLIALGYVFILKSIFERSIWEGLILGLGGYYSVIFANRTSKKIIEYFIQKNKKE